MGKKLLLSTAFVGVFACALVANIPLLFALRQSGLVQQGIGWQQARGTVWHGQVTGLVVQGDVAGAPPLSTHYWNRQRCIFYMF